MKKAYSFVKKALIFSLLLVTPLYFYAQETGDNGTDEAAKTRSSFSPYWFATGHIGISQGWMDMSKDATPFSKLKTNTLIGTGFSFGRQLSSVFGVRAQMMYSKINTTRPDLNTETLNEHVYNYNLNLTLDLINLFWGYNEDRKFGLYGTTGIGWVNFNTRHENSITGVVNYEAGYGKGNGLVGFQAELNVPVGLGVAYHASDKIDIAVETNMYTLFGSDKIDLMDGMAGGIKNDKYSTATLNLTYKFVSNQPKKMAANFEKVELTATPDPLEERGDSVEVTIKGTFPPKYFGKKAVMCFAPVLVYDGGETVFPVMTFKGEDVAGDGQLINYTNGGSFTYTGKIPYDPAMNVAELEIAPVIFADNGESYETCDAAMNAKKAYMAEPRKLADGTIYTSEWYRDTEVIAWAPDAYEKETISTVGSNLFFQVNLAQLNWKLPLNKNDDNYNALKNNLSDIEKGWELKDVTINGWASPEGEETFNEGLSQRRAETAKKYMEGKMKKAAKTIDGFDPTTVNYVLKSNGPDWNGFMKAVQASAITDKNAILNVINAADPSKKEEEIRNMILIYPEIEKNILPPLRRAEINVNAYEPKKTDEEIAQLSTTDPSQLDMEELFYAATLTDDFGNKRLIYASIIEFYPKCWRSVNNAAAVELAEGNLEIAKDLLMKAVEMNENAYEIHNNMGVYHILNGDFTSAEKCFTKAQSLGGDLNYNLGLVNIAKGDYAKAEMLLKGANCDFNKGLAQLLNGNNSGAEATFQCAPQDAETLYLLAVTASRSGDKAKTLDYLGKAIKADPEVGKLAGTDREFLKYYNDADFQALVNM